jgi:hypothetical protein
MQILLEYVTKPSKLSKQLKKSKVKGSDKCNNLFEVKSTY